MHDCKNLLHVAGTVSFHHFNDFFFHRKNPVKEPTQQPAYAIVSFFYFRKDHPRDTVILHQFERGPYAPSMTPYAIKVETYLRMAKIPYKVGIHV